MISIFLIGITESFVEYNTRMLHVCSKTEIFRDFFTIVKKKAEIIF